MARPRKTDQELQKELSDEFRDFFEPIARMMDAKNSDSYGLEEAFGIASKLWNDYYFDKGAKTSHVKDYMKAFQNQPEYVAAFKEAFSRKKRFDILKGGHVLGYKRDENGKLYFTFHLFRSLSDELKASVEQP